MIDTIKIVIPYSSFVITKPERFGGEAQIRQMENCYVTGNAKFEYPNNPTKAEQEQGYFPRLTLSRTAFQINDEFLNLKIECSLPKILFGNNVQELYAEEFSEVINTLLEKLEVMGVQTTYDVIENAYVQKIDFAKNFQIMGNVGLFINCLDKIDLDPRLGQFDRDYQNGGSGIKFHTKEYQIMIYNKIAEIEKALKYSDSKSLTQDNQHQANIIRTLKERGIKIIRYEVSFKRKMMKRYINIESYTFKNLFNPDISKAVLSHYIARIHAGMRSVNVGSRDTVSMIELIKSAFPNARHSKIARLHSLIQIVNEHGYDFLRYTLDMNSSAISKVRDEIRQIGAMQRNNSILDDLEMIENTLERFRPFRLRNI